MVSSYNEDDDYRVDHSDVITHLFFPFKDWANPYKVKKKRSGLASFNIFKITSHQHPFLQFHWSRFQSLVHPTFQLVVKKWVGPIIMRDDVTVVHPLINTLATVANLRSLHLSLIINLIVTWPKFEFFLHPYLLFWY